MNTHGGLRDIATLLGVSNNQVYMWIRRRSRTGFPEPTAYYIGPDKRRTRKPLFDLNQVMAWYITYTPRRGGAPRGNSNALRHGRYQGRRRRQYEQGV